MKLRVARFAVGLVLSSLSCWAQVGVSNPSSIRIHEFSEQGPAQDILQALAERYHFVVGVYGIMVGKDQLRSIDIKIQDGTLADAFDAIAKSDPRFKWHLDSSGSVHFVTPGSPLTLMEISVRSFGDKDPQQDEVLNHLFDLADLSGWLQEHNCGRSPNTIIIAGHHPKPWPKFKVHAESVALPQILDQIAAKSKTYYWKAIQYSVNPCGIDLRWGDAP